MKFILRFIQRLLMFLGVVLPLQLLGAIVLLIYLPIHLARIKEYPGIPIRLPYLLRWFDNADLYVGRDTSVYLSVFGSGYWNLYNWLAWRNPLNYFGYKILGITNTTGAKLPDDNVGDATGQEPGLRTVEITLNGKSYYEYYYIKKWNATHCFRFRMGWKLGGKIPFAPIQWVFVISPWHSYNGI